MRNIFDHLSGNFSAAMDTPYNLTAVAGVSGFKATALDNVDATKAGSHLVTRGSSLKLGPSMPSRAACYANRVRLSSSNPSKTKDNQTESVRNLTDGAVVVTEEVDVHFDHQLPSSPDGSQVSWDNFHRRTTDTY